MRPEDDPIVIVGLSCRLPGDATSPDAFWDMLVQGRSAWGEPPKNRFSLRGYHHPSAERQGTTLTKTGYFLQDDVNAYDAPFFSMTSVEAVGTDPQQRLLLEMSYEALENAGIAMKEVIGSDTACYMGCFSQDFRGIQAAQVCDQPLYLTTGVGNNMLSNRISWFYDLRGPSIMIDTACSSSMVALHLACQSLQTGESSMALVGGVNLMLSPDIFCGMSRLRFLSPDGVCHTFDSRANGYARGEGAAVLVAKRLSDAVRNNDTIRAVIRATAINQDGKTPSITVPSALAQADLIRQTYQKAGLPLHQTTYFEAHVTGTPQGDFNEMSALGATFGADENRETALYVGSVKTNIGHGEGLAGVNSLVKTVLMLERGIIPPLVGFETLNPRIKLDEWRLQLPLEAIPWPASGLRRASINSFGYGGTNAHTIMDDAAHFLLSRSIIANHHTLLNLEAASTTTTLETKTGEKLITLPQSESQELPKILIFSSPERDGCNKIAKSLHRRLQGPEIPATEDSSTEDSSVDGSSGDDTSNETSSNEEEVQSPQLHDTTRQIDFDDLVYTINHRRSIFEWRSFVITDSVAKLTDQVAKDLPKYKQAHSQPKCAFVFTGQGAQWYAMGRELSAYPTFRKALERADGIITCLSADWSLLQELGRDQDNTRINGPALSQPICTAIQLALVDLLKQWGLQPSHVVGHSSGEIAAAYTIGALTFRDAITTAYFRGLCCSQMKTDRPDLKGAMLAAALSADDAQEILDKVEAGAARVACINSPLSVTISGDEEAIACVERVLSSREIWNRRLVIDIAYHSHHMNAIAAKYRSLLSAVQASLTDSNIVMYSSVTGGVVSATDLTPEYWVTNLLSPVKFDTTVQSLLTDSASKKKGKKPQQITALLEIGPHNTLRGPLRQILKAVGEKFEKNVTYMSILRRDENAISTALEALATLWTTGVDIDLAKVNMNKVESPCKLLPELPSFPWNHSKSYWQETRQSKQHRQTTRPRTDLLGFQEEGFSRLSPRWLNYLRPVEIPWVLDHKIQGVVLFPAAAMISMAIEAATQIADVRKVLIGVEFRDIIFNAALVFQSTESVIETVFELHPYKPGTRSRAARGWTFRLMSVDRDSNATEHCSGLVDMKYESAQNEVEVEPEVSRDWRARVAHRETLLQVCHNEVDDAGLYDRLDEGGMQYGPTFRVLRNIKTAPHTGVVDIMIPDTASVMPCEFEYPSLIHPTVLDGMFQTMVTTDISTMNSGAANVPTFIERMQVTTKDFPNEPGTLFHAFSESKLRGAKDTIGYVVVGDQDFSRPLVLVDGFVCTEMSGDLYEEPTAAKTCAVVEWTEDVAYLDHRANTFLRLAAEPFQSDLAARSELLDHAAAIYFSRTAKALSKLNEPEQPETHARYRDWILQQGALFEGMKQNYDSALTKYKGSDDDFIAHCAAEASMAGDVIRKIGEQLPAILTGATDANTILAEPDLIRNFMDLATPRPLIIAGLNAWLNKAGGKNPDQQILEFVDSSRTIAKPVLDHLTGKNGEPTRFGSYSVCTPSDNNLELEPAVANHSLVEKCKLDIDTSLEEQGLSLNYYDIVLWDATTTNQDAISKYLPVLRRFVKNGGKLIVLTITQIKPKLVMVLGLSEDWWDQHAPMQRYAWDSSLKEHGFSGVDIIHHDFVDSRQQQLSMIITSPKVDLEVDPSIQSVVLLYPNRSNNQLKSLGKRLYESLIRLGLLVKFGSLESLEDVKSTAFISLLNLGDEQLLANMDKTTFKSVQTLCLESAGLLWLTSADITGSIHSPFSGIFTGLLRTIRSENPHLRLCQLDLERSPTEESDSNLEFATKSILHVFSELITAGEVPTEAEYALREKILCIPRARRQREATDLLTNRGKPPRPAICPLYQENRPMTLTMTTPGLLDTLHFDDLAPDVKIKQSTLGPYQVRFTMQAVGLNFMDVMGAMGQMPEARFGTEAAGVITEIGRLVTLWQPGDLVYGLVMDAMATEIVTDEALVHTVPSHLTVEEAIACPTACFTAYVALIQRAKLQKGETILIHSAAGGLGQAAIQLAQWIGAKVFVSVGSKVKKQMIMDQYGIDEEHIFNSRDTDFAAAVKRLTNGVGVDVILNSLSGEKLRQTWSCIAEFGRFIEVGKADAFQNSGLDMSVFLRHVEFHGINLEVLGGTRDRSRFKDVAKAVFDLVDEQVLRPAYPINKFPFSNIEQAFRLMQSGQQSGKTVLYASPDERVPAIPIDAYPLQLSPNATYVLSGGLGGIGRSLGMLLAKHGAKHLLFLARPSALSGSEEYLENLRTVEEVDAQVLICDITDKDHLAKALGETMTNMPPIKGLIQCAMVLRDGMFELMNHDDWSASIAPKVAGTWNLHCLLPEDLDFFIMLSSVSGVIGNRGQANYAAGNVFQDQLAAHRRARGLKATSLALGAVADVGFLTKKDMDYFEQGVEVSPELQQVEQTTGQPEDYKSRVLQGLKALQINEADIHDLIKCAITGQIKNDTCTPAQIITGLGTGVKIVGMNASLLRLLEKTDANGSASGNDSADDEELRIAFTRAENVHLVIKGVEDALISRLARALQVAPEDIDSELPLYTYGVDSLIAVELRNWMLAKLKSDISVFDILSPMPIKDVASKIVVKSGLLSATLKAQLADEGITAGDESPDDEKKVDQVVDDDAKKEEEAEHDELNAEATVDTKFETDIATESTTNVEIMVGTTTETKADGDIKPAFEVFDRKALVSMTEVELSDSEDSSPATPPPPYDTMAGEVSAAG